MEDSLKQRVVWQTTIGNLFEHYDGALFGFLSIFLAPLMFPNHEPMTALILTYALMPLSMLARPFGALVFGYIGDVHGRGRALFWTLAGMGAVSGFIAFLPTYAQVGIAAPILFCLLRACQNFLAAGESMGGAIFLLENSSKRRYDLLSSLFQGSSIAGHLLASLGVFLISYFHCITPGWRFLYLIGCITALFGCLLRKSASPFIPSERSFYFANLKKGLKLYYKPFFYILLCAGFAHATYGTALILMNGFVPFVSGWTQVDMMQMNSYLLLVDCCTMPLFGWIASKVGRDKVMLGAACGVILFSMPLLLLLQGATWWHIILIRGVFVLFGVAFCAPLHAWMQELVEPKYRYQILSLGYAVGAQLLGSPTSALALWCFKKTGMITSIGWYWSALALAGGLSVILTWRKRLVIREKVLRGT